MDLELKFLLDEDVDPLDDFIDDVDYDKWLEREREFSSSCRGLFI